jgi:hypothetical protein
MAESGIADQSMVLGLAAGALVAAVIAIAVAVVELPDHGWTAAPLLAIELVLDGVIR